MMLEFGYHGIPLIWFEYGFRLPMHPFHLEVYEALGCGIAQLAPNSLALVSGLIARCSELHIEPTLEMLFSIYRIKIFGSQLYLDKRDGVDSLCQDL